MWSSKEKFEFKIIPSSSLVLSDMMVGSSILGLRLSLPENNYFHVVKVKPFKKNFE